MTLGACLMRAEVTVKAQTTQPKRNTNRGYLAAADLPVFHVEHVIGGTEQLKVRVQGR